MLSGLTANMYSHNIFQCALPSIPDENDDDGEEEDEEDDDGGSGSGSGEVDNGGHFQANIVNSTIDSSDQNVNNGRLTFEERLLGLKMSGFQFANNFIPTSHSFPPSSNSKGSLGLLKEISMNDSNDDSETGMNAAKEADDGIYGMHYHTNNILMRSNNPIATNHSNNHGNENGYALSFNPSTLHEYEMSLLYPLRSSSEAQNVLESTGFFYHHNYLSKFNELNEVVNNEVNDQRNGLLDMNDNGSNRNNSNSNSNSNSNDNNNNGGEDNTRSLGTMNGSTAMMRNNLELLSDSSSGLSLQQLPVHSLIQQHQHLLQQQQPIESMEMRGSNNLTSLQHPMKQMIILDSEEGGSSRSSSSSSSAGGGGCVDTILQYSQANGYGVTTSISAMGQRQMFGNDVTIQV